MKTDMPFFSLEQLDTDLKIEQDWLFERILGELNAQRHLILAADRVQGVHEYARELGFQLVEKNSDIHLCHVNISSARSTASFLQLFESTLSNKFPEVTARLKPYYSDLDPLKLPGLIAKRKKVRIAIFMANAHLLFRFMDPQPFLRKMKIKLIRQKNCIFCLYGNNTQNFMKVVRHPGPLAGLGRVFVLKHDPLNYRSASVRKLFHDHQKNIGYQTSSYLSSLVDNHPFYLKLLAWHTLMRTHHTCTDEIVKNAMTDLLRHYDYGFVRVVESLTPVQISFLEALIDEHRQLYSRSVREKYDLGSTGNVARIKQSLIKKEIIYPGKRISCFVDPIFREWLQRRYFGRPAFGSPWGIGFGE
ncbi:MAG TPA: hypothetical protein ENO05_00775 [Bacteroides sp.]|nr:hypothetical protein [Bacteroides sp.]